MITVKVTYRVRPAFVQQNIENLQQALAQLNNPDIRYQVFLGADGQTFTHISIYKNTQAQQALLHMPAFHKFQQLRDESGLEMEAQVEEWSLVTAVHN